MSEEFPMITEEFEKELRAGKWRSRGFLPINIHATKRVLESTRRLNPEKEFVVYRYGDYDNHLFEKVTKDTVFLPNPNTLDIGFEEQ